MCYAIPGRVEALDGRFAIVSYFGETKKALYEIPDLKPGDYVYAQGGFVVERLSPEAALDILDTWQELFAEMKLLDGSPSRAGTGVQVTDPSWQAFFARIERGEENPAVHGSETLSGNPVSFWGSAELPPSLVSLAEARDLLLTEDPMLRAATRQAANALRQRYHGNSCCVHGIIEFSNHCGENCQYCGLSRHHSTLERYHFSSQELIESVRESIDRYGFRALVLQAGNLQTADEVTELSRTVRAIREHFPVLICISVGEIGEDGLKTLYEAGARAVLIRFETSNDDLYRSVHPGSTLEQRLKEIDSARRLGFLIMTGSLIGLPGQTMADLVNDLFLTRQLNPDMWSFGPFLPHPSTPMAKKTSPSPDLVLQVLALARLVAPPEGKILVTTAFETLSATARQDALSAGASSLMLNVTPLRFRPLFSIYPDRLVDHQPIQAQIDETISLLHSLGRAPTDLSVNAPTGTVFPALAPSAR